MTTSLRVRSKYPSASSTRAAGRPQVRSSSSDQLEQQVAEQDRRRGAVLLRARRTSRGRGAAARTRGGWPAGRGVRRRRPCSRRAPARWRAAARARRRPATARPRRPASGRRRGGPTSRTPPGSACRRTRWCARARPAGRRPAPSASSQVGLLVDELQQRASMLGRGTRPRPTRSPSPRHRRATSVTSSPGERSPRILAPWVTAPRDAASATCSRRASARSPSSSSRRRTRPARSQLWRSISELEPLRPTFVSVTYGAGGTTRDRTIAITGRIARETTMTADGAPHLRRAHPRRAERGSSTSLAAAGVAQRARAARRPAGRPAARRGRRPRAGSTTPSSWSRWSARSATSASGWPPSPRATATPPTLDARRRRCCGPSTTPAPSSRSPRWCSAPSDYFGLVERAAAAGVDFPIIPGIMPILNLGSMAQDGRAVRRARCPTRCWPGSSRSRTTRPRYAPRASRSPPSSATTLLAGGAPGLHFYTLNRSKATREIYAALACHA